MRRRESKLIVPVDPEIEKTCRQNRKSKREERAVNNNKVELAGEMATNGNNGGNGGVVKDQAAGLYLHERSLRDYILPSLKGVQSSIRAPGVDANNFELKSTLIKMVEANDQFRGTRDEDPTMHLTNFMELCGTLKINGVSDEAIRLRLFPFSLRDKAKHWLVTQPPNSILTWEDLAIKFLSRFFPPAKAAKYRGDINNFVQQVGETLYEA